MLETTPDETQRSETLLRVFLLGAVDRARPGVHAGDPGAHPGDIARLDA